MTNTGEFDFNVTIPDTQWLVEDLIPKGHLCFVLAKAGVGKSLLVEALSLYCIHASNFIGKKTIEGDVLIIDQDSPENVLKKRLIRLNAAFNIPPKYKLFIKQGSYKLSDGTLMTLINDYPSVVLVIIDSLHSVCGRLDPNSTTDMNKLSGFKDLCLKQGKTIIFNHHISQKYEATLDDLMTGETGQLAMGNSAIMQQADSYYIVGATANNGLTNRIYVRPVAKREAIPSKPIIIRLIQKDNGEALSYDGVYEPELDADIYRDIIMLFRELNKERTVEEIYKDMGHRHGENAVRKALIELDKQGKILLSRSKSNLFKYHLP